MALSLASCLPGSPDNVGLGSVRNPIHKQTNAWFGSASLGNASVGLLSGWTPSSAVMDQGWPLLRFRSRVLGEKSPFLSHFPGLLALTLESPSCSKTQLQKTEAEQPP